MEGEPVTDSLYETIRADLKRADELDAYYERLPPHVTSEARAEAENLRDGVRRQLADMEARHEILRAAVEHVINDSPGTPETVKGWLRKALRGERP